MVVTHHEPHEPTVLESVLRYRVLVASVAVAFALLAVAAALRSGGTWEAAAELVVEDPRNAAVFERGAAEPGERYVETQASILRSVAVASRVQELARLRDPPVDLSLETLLDDVDVQTSPDSALITVAFTHDDPFVAIAVPNLVAEAYAEERRAAALQSFQAAIDELDESITEAASDLAAIEILLDEERGVTEERLQLDAQFDEAVRRLVELQDPATIPGLDVPAFPGSEVQRAAIRAQLDAMLLVLQIEAEQPELVALRRQQLAAIDRLAARTDRRDQLRVDAELAGSGVVLFSEAQRALKAESGTLQLGTLGLVFGAMLGSGLAYFLALRRRRITGRAEPEAVLRVPLLAEIPEFDLKRDQTPLPVADAPGTAAAEAFRFAAAAVDSPVRGSAPAPVLGVVSGSIGDGKSTVAANLALAAARQGNRVLAIDADFGDQSLSRLLLPFEAPTSGIVACVAGQVDTSEAVYVVESSPQHALHLMPRGSGLVTAPEFFHRSDVGEFLARMSREYDLVVLDTPPLLQVAYATTLLGLADSAVVVVSHDTATSQLEALRDRLELIGTPVRGYVYNRAPGAGDRDGAVGSLQDRLGRRLTGVPGE